MGIAIGTNLWIRSRRFRHHERVCFHLTAIENSRPLDAALFRIKLSDLPNPNSGTDAVTLQNGRHVLVYNHSDTEKVRYPLNVAVSRDGKSWDAAAVLETEPPGQYSYPAVIQASNGLVHVAYTWKRLRMKHMVLDPARFGSRRIVRGAWPE